MTRFQYLSIPMNWKPVFLKIISGAVIGLILICTFIFPVSEPDPEWGKFWRLRPLIIAPLAGAFAGFWLCAIDFLLLETKWQKVLVVACSIGAFLITLFLGIVLGLDGTLWN